MITKNCYALFRTVGEDYCQKGCVHDNVWSYVAAEMREMIDSFKWEVFDHPTYSPDLSPRDLHLSPRLKEFLGGVHLESDKELKSTVNRLLASAAVNFYDKRIKKLVSQYDV